MRSTCFECVDDGEPNRHRYEVIVGSRRFPYRRDCIDMRTK
jgi:hypothetical protein